mgnify:CR=1 FL=1
MSPLGVSVEPPPLADTHPSLLKEKKRFWTGGHARGATLLEEVAESEEKGTRQAGDWFWAIPQPKSVRI